MRYSSTIDNVTSLKWGFKIQDAYVFSFLYSLPSWAEQKVVGDSVFYFASRKKATQEIPLLTDEPDTMYRYYKKLQKLGVINYITIDKKDYIEITQKGKQWNSENNPSLGNKSEKTRKIIRENSENNPTYKNTSNKDTNNKNKNPYNPQGDSAVQVVEKSTSRFTPPTKQQVKQYCLERKNDIDPEEFIDFYQSKGWLVGKTKMKDWKSAIRNWERRRKEKQSKESGKKVIKNFFENGI